MNDAQRKAATELANSAQEFSVIEIADVLDLHPATIRLWIRENRLKSVRKDGRKWLVRGDEVAQLLASTPSLGFAHRSRYRPRADGRQLIESSVPTGRRRPSSGPRAIAMSIGQGLGT